MANAWHRFGLSWLAGSGLLGAFRVTIKLDSLKLPAVPQHQGLLDPPVLQILKPAHSVCAALEYPCGLHVVQKGALGHIVAKPFEVIEQSVHK